MNDHDYHSLPRLSASGAKVLLKSPARFKYERDAPPAPTAEMRFGTLLHCLVLEPDQFESRYAVAPDVDKRTTAGKEAFARWQFNNQGKDAVSVDEYDRANRMADAVRMQAGSLLMGGEAEKPVLWERDGVPLKAKMDYVGEYIVDLKTTSADDEDSLVRNSWTFGYHVSAAAYQEAAQILTGRKMDKMFVFVTKTEPYDVVVLKAGDEFLSRGKAKWDAAIRLYAACMEFDNWLGLSSRIENNVLNPPRWA